MNPATDAVQDANPAADVSAAYAYLSHYGYLTGAVLSGAATPLLAVEDVGKGVSEFQRTAGIPVTGEIDQATIDMMSRPRCGCLDVQRMGVEEAKWRKNRLTYFVQDHVNGLPVVDQMAIIDKAFSQWSVVADIQATLAGSAQGADIIISVGKGQAQGFDGPSGTLAWAYLPTGNDAQLLMRFDIDETWVSTGGGGILMLNVACHEFGHLLGLDHSKNSAALMAPFYSPAINKPQSNDDIPRMQALYGPAVGTPPVPPAKPKRMIVQFEVENLIGVSIPGYKVVPA